ncbi:uncharacterized protein MONOS_8018 [Monocercomonoides exilis]|uniref:uncharacterized protein n=1 Tax=Monocercomonoides exilis TaxID=2049356 RepID=UPI003559A086|nr:hypothetical protein MONOS_8018 [Monocercomonoides exilis]|eukprot:MONOS_8018.1-p1 / transcript=MONOS_8018.1 / gene=MONOS_8018 / organism=Monocercomonoides_exilis_PA203 / gene_product=unspecified product / transcript_product=unspecified product / location=Mono_scaffold00291:16851-19357(-) / protein_length=614 / sequence_SO=supercontig / SO=protein_coding / is_pseudo=false
MPEGNPPNFASCKDSTLSVEQQIVDCIGFLQSIDNTAVYYSLQKLCALMIENPANLKLMLQHDILHAFIPLLQIESSDELYVLSLSLCSGILAFTSAIDRTEFSLVLLRPLVALSQSGNNQIALSAFQLLSSLFLRASPEGKAKAIDSLFISALVNLLQHLDQTADSHFHVDVMHLVSAVCECSKQNELIAPLREPLQQLALSKQRIIRSIAADLLKDFFSSPENDAAHFSSSCQPSPSPSSTFPSSLPLHQETTSATPSASASASASVTSEFPHQNLSLDFEATPSSSASVSVSTALPASSSTPEGQMSNEVTPANAQDSTLINENADDETRFVPTLNEVNEKKNEKKEKSENSCANSSINEKCCCKQSAEKESSKYCPSNQHDDLERSHPEREVAHPANQAHPAHPAHPGTVAPLLVAAEQAPAVAPAVALAPVVFTTPALWRRRGGSIVHTGQRGYDSFVINQEIRQGIWHFEVRIGRINPNYAFRLGVMNANLPAPQQDTPFGDVPGTAAISCSSVYVQTGGYSTWGAMQYRQTEIALLEINMTTMPRTLHFFRNGKQQKLFVRGLPAAVKVGGCIFEWGDSIEILNFREVDHKKAVKKSMDRAIEWRE